MNNHPNGLRELSARQTAMAVLIPAACSALLLSLILLAFTNSIPSAQPPHQPVRPGSCALVCSSVTQLACRDCFH